MKRNATLRPTSTDLDHALVVACGLTQILGCTRWGQLVSMITIHGDSILYDFALLLSFV